MAFDFSGLLPQFKALISSAQLKNRFTDIKTYLTTTFNPADITLPSTVGSSGQILQSDGDNTTSWATTGSLTDGDKTDITVSGGGGTWTIDNDAITTAKIADNNVTTAKIADNNVTTAKIADNNVTFAKIEDVAANSVLARAASSLGDVSEVALGASELLGRGSTGNVAAITVGSNLNLTGTTIDLAQDPGTLYKTTSDQTSIGHSTETVVTGLSFTPAVSTTYLITTYLAWENTAPTTNGAYFGVANTLTGYGYDYFSGLARSSESGITSTEVAINDSNRTQLFTASTTLGNMYTHTIMFNTDGTSTGDFSVVALAENASGTVTIRKGSSMLVQVMS
jgi:hypothetical protein